METWKLKKRTPVSRGSKKSWKLRVGALVLLAATGLSGAYDFSFLWKGTENPYRLGLDLQGGTHLVYETDMTQIPDAERAEALEGVRDVIERRVNAFGVAEPVVQTTSSGGSDRVIVELAGVLDVKEAIKQIGETPVLEFKEPGAELGRDLTPEEQTQLDTAQAADRAAAEDVLKKARAGTSFDLLVAEFSKDEDKDTTKGVLDSLGLAGIYEPMVQAVIDNKTTPGYVVPKVVESEEGLIVEKYLEKAKSTDMLLSMILVCFEGKENCENPMPALEASIQIDKAKQEANKDNFTEIVQKYSTDKTGDGTGDMGWVAPGQIPEALELAARATPVGGISSVVETEYGYVIVLKRDEREVDVYKMQRVLLPLTQATDIVGDLSPWKNTSLSGKQLTRAQVQFDQTTGAPHVTLQFNDEGSQLFGELTSRLVGQPIAIFLDNQPISIPRVQQAIYGGQAIITGDFSLDEAKVLAQRLNAGALPVPVKLLSQETVGPTLGLASLEKSIHAAYIGFALVALFMIAVYRLPGLLAILALVLYVFLNLAAYRVFGVTVTLSGIAGLVLSLGIAVDANVLIFERLKDEYRSGRDLVTSIDEGFKRAWAPIRDGHLTTLISALVLYGFSSSFVRGFALTLAVGVILSLFTAITVTRVYLKNIRGFRWFQAPWLYGLTRNDQTK